METIIPGDQQDKGCNRNAAWAGDLEFSQWGPWLREDGGGGGGVHAFDAWA